MFLCCDCNKQTNKTAYIESIDHKNPISRRINSKKTSRSHARPLHQSTLHLNIVPAEKYSNVVHENLSKSLFVSQHQEVSLKGTKLTQKTTLSAQKQWPQQSYQPKEDVVALKKQANTLEKYVSVLEKSNRYLQTELSRHKALTRSRYKNDLLQLRDRLKKIDFSNVCKDLELNRQPLKTAKTTSTTISEPPPQKLIRLKLK